MTPTAKRNNGAPDSFTLKQIAELLGGELIGDPQERITGVAGIKEAKRGDISFVSNAKYLPFLSETAASAVIVDPAVSAPGKNLIRLANPSRAFTALVIRFQPSHEPLNQGIHPTAFVGKNTKLGLGVSLGPHAVLGDDVTVGDRTAIEAGSYVGSGSRLGSDVRVYPNVTIREESVIGDRVIIHSGAVIGSDGFGYETVGGKHEKIPQTGSVMIEDDVEIGANVCIDRGRFQKTWIKKGVKIDNLVQIAHNVVVGENSLLVSQCGISGSSELGTGVVVAGQAGIVGHVTLGDRSIVGAGAGVTKSVAPDTIVLGQPAKPISEQKRIFALIARLPELFKDLSEIKKKLGLQ